MAKLHIKEKYGVTPNMVLNSSYLTFKAKGLFGYLQSKPESWKFSISRIAKQTKDGEYGIKRAIKELENYGLLRRTPIKNSLGKWSGYDYELVDYPLAENPSAENPLAENHTTLSKKESSKKDIVRKKNGKVKNLAGDEIGEAREIRDLIEAFTLVNPACKKMYGNTTQREACSFLIKEYSFSTILQVINLLPKTNIIKYIPTITTPIQLRDKWVQLEAGLTKIKKSNSKILETNPNKYDEIKQQTINT